MIVFVQNFNIYLFVSTCVFAARGAGTIGWDKLDLKTMRALDSAVFSFIRWPQEDLEKLPSWFVEGSKGFR